MIFYSYKISFVNNFIPSNTKIKNPKKDYLVFDGTTQYYTVLHCTTLYGI